MAPVGGTQKIYAGAKLNADTAVQESQNLLTQTAGFYLYNSVRGQTCRFWV